MDDFKKLTEQLMKIYSNAESVNDLGIENYFDENISLIGTGKHELFANLHEFLESLISCFVPRFNRLPSVITASGADGCNSFTVLPNPLPPDVAKRTIFLPLKS